MPCRDVLAAREENSHQDEGQQVALSSTVSVKADHQGGLLTSSEF